MADVNYGFIANTKKKLVDMGDGTHAERQVSALQPISTAVATIANGESLSAAVDLGGWRVAGIVMPASWTAANLTLQTSPDGETYNNRYDRSGTEYTITAAASRSIQIPLDDLLSVRFIKVRSGTSGSPVNQGAERSITLVLVR